MLVILAVALRIGRLLYGRVGGLLLGWQLVMGVTQLGYKIKSMFLHLVVLVGCPIE